MKIVLSRKGFDSSSGRVPSPVLRDGTAVPLPVSARCGPARFQDVPWPNGSLATLFKAGIPTKPKARNAPATKEVKTAA